jgi:speckle-type POZ protein
MDKISTSSRCLKESTATLSLEVTNYLQLKGVNAGDYVSSRVFSVGGYDWEIRFYPGGIDEQDCAGKASVFVWFLGKEDKDVGAKFTMSMLENKTKAQVASFDVRKRFFRNPEYRCWGFPEFVDKSRLESLSRCGDGCFTILCVLTVSLESSPLELPDHFEQILRDGRGTDVVFGVAGHEFAAHKSLLAARSSVFGEQFFEPKAEKDMLRVEVLNMEPAIFEMMLHYIYTDSLPDCEDEGGYGTATMQDLLAAASSYKLDRLKIICEDELRKRIDQETVTTLSALADQHGCNRLKVACDKFVPSSK